MRLVGEQVSILGVGVWVSRLALISHNPNFSLLHKGSWLSLETKGKMKEKILAGCENLGSK